MCIRYLAVHYSSCSCVHEGITGLCKKAASLIDQPLSLRPNHPTPICMVVNMHEPRRINGLCDECVKCREDEEKALRREQKEKEDALWAEWHKEVRGMKDKMERLAARLKLFEGIDAVRDRAKELAREREEKAAEDERVGEEKWHAALAQYEEAKREHERWKVEREKELQEERNLLTGSVKGKKKKASRVK